MKSELGAVIATTVCCIFFLGLISLLVAWPFMWIWNFAVVAAVSVAKPISYWIAFWLMVFCGTFIAGSNVGGSK